MTPGMDDGNILLTKFLREKMTENYRVSFCHIMSQKASSLPRLTLVYSPVRNNGMDKKNPPIAHILVEAAPFRYLEVLQKNNNNNNSGIQDKNTRILLGNIYQMKLAKLR